MTRENVRAKARGLGAELADLREQAGMTMREVGDRLGWSPATMCRIENGKRDSTPEEIASLLVVYKITGARNDRMVHMAKTIDQSGWCEIMPEGVSRHLTALRAFEAEATRLTDVAMILVPGLLQTPEYTRAMVEASGAREIDDLVAIKAGRQAVLGRRKPPEFHAIIDEAVLRRPLGGPEIMAAQLRKLVRDAARPHITIQVVRNPVHCALSGTYYTLEFPSPAQPFVLLSNYLASSFLDDVDAVQAYLANTVTLAETALDPMRSQEFLAHLAQRYESQAGAAVHDRAPGEMA